MYIEAVGWIASVLLLTSLFVENKSYFRWCVLTGNLLYLYYGLLIYSMPVIVLNAACLVLNLYYLHYIYHRKEDYGVCLVDKNETFFRYFLDFYRKDIFRYFPDFHEDLITEKTSSYIIIRNNQPIGIFILEKVSEGQLSVVLDYVAPFARNCKAGLFIHGKLLKELADNKVQVVISKIISPMHKKYLEKIGYTTSAVNARIIINLK